MHFSMGLWWTLYIAPKPPKWGSEMQNCHFPFKIALHLKKVCYKVALCEYCQRHSCKVFTDLSILNLSWECCDETFCCLISRCPNFHCNGKIIFKIILLRGPWTLPTLHTPLVRHWDKYGPTWSTVYFGLCILFMAACVVQFQSKQVAAIAMWTSFSFVIIYAVLSTKHELFIWDTLEILVVRL